MIKNNTFQQIEEDLRKNFANKNLVKFYLNGTTSVITRNLIDFNLTKDTDSYVLSNKHIIIYFTAYEIEVTKNEC